MMVGGSAVLEVPLRVSLFGRLRVLNGERVLDDRSFPSRKAKQVFEMLALAGGLPVSKNHLIEVLWGDHLPKNPAATLENSISVLRTALAGDGSGSVILTGAGSYGLNTGVATIDLQEFDILVREASRLAPAEAIGRLTDALKLVRGEVLEDEPGSEWTLPLRHEYRRRVESVALEGARLALVLEQPERSLELSQRAQRASAVPSEDAYQLEVAALLRLDRRSDAHVLLRTADAALQHEFGTGLGPDLVALRDLLRARPPTLSGRPAVVFAPDGPPPATVPFVGRAAEVAQIGAAIAAVAAGCSASVVIEGPAGSGKTRLLNELAAGPHPATVVALSCTPAARAFHRFAATRLHRILGGAAGPSFARPLAAVGADAAAELFERLAESIAALAPVVVLIDDIHLADDASIAILHALAQPGVAPGFGIVATRRPSSCRPTPEVGVVPTVSMKLGPLTPEALAELGLPDGTWFTGGHAGVAAACLEAWQLGGRFTAGAVASILERCDEAGPLARHVLASAAAAEDPLSPSELAYVAGLAPGTVEEVVEQARGLRLLAASDTVQLRDEITRRVLLTSLSERRLNSARLRSRSVERRRA